MIAQCPCGKIKTIRPFTNAGLVPWRCSVECKEKFPKPLLPGEVRDLTPTPPSRRLETPKKRFLPPPQK